MRTTSLVWMIVLSIGLSGCALFQSDPAPVIIGCPKIREYSDSEQSAIASALATLPQDSALIDPLLEWSSLRDQLKVCQPKSKSIFNAI